MTVRDKHAKAQAAPKAQPSLTTADEAPAVLSPQALRRLAEARLLKKAALAPEDIKALSPEATQQLLHELRVHQIELEMQNEELRESHVALDIVRSRYFELYDLAPVGYCTVSEAGLIKQANLTAAGLLGVTRDELIAKPLTRFIHREDEDRYYLHRKVLVENGESPSCELRMVKKDGGEFWVNLASTIAHDTAGAIELRTVLSDVTARTLAEQARRESAERYHNLFNSIDEGFCVIEMIFDQNQKPVDYRFLEVNPSFEKQSGLHGAAGRLMSDFSPNLETHWYEVYGRVALTGEPVRIVEEARELENRWFDVHAFRLGGPQSRKVAILFNDTTERKQIELKIRDARDMADKANRAKSEFLSSMSHELRTPLNAILGFAQLLESGSPQPAPVQKKNIDHILRSGWYLLSLINEILDLAVVEAGTLSMSMEPVPMAEVLRDCEAMLQVQARASGIGMRFARIDAPCVVLGDRNRIKQILSNLLSNAIKYNKPDGTVVVDLITSTPGRVRVCVTDNGDGLTPDKLAQLFQPFNRLGQENSAVEGTGIGLVVSKRLVELMNGGIGVESTPGQGSTFWFELGLAGEVLPAPAAAAGPAATLTPTESGGGAPLRTLLYVEDNPANLALVQGIIARRADLRLLTAIDGRRGVEMARTSQPDVILMDINLPDISGIDARRILAQDPATARIPVIAISANAMASDIQNGLDAGFFHYITKPLRIDEFMKTLDMALEFSQAVSGRDGKKEQA